MSIKPLIAAAVACGMLAGCATTVAGHPSLGAPASGGARSSPTSSDQRVLAGTAIATWLRASDVESGVRFQLPTKPVRTAHTQAGVKQRIYAAELGTDDAAVSFGVIDLGSAGQAEATVASYADSIEAEFRAAGAPDDFRISERIGCNYQGHSCQDMRIGFTPLREPDRATLWLIRVLVDGPEVVLLQTVASAPKAEQQPDLVLVRKIQRRLIESVDFP